MNKWNIERKVVGYFSETLAILNKQPFRATFVRSEDVGTRNVNKF